MQSRFKYPVEQTDPPRSPRETLPTMYDLPSENPEEPGLPDEFHDLQPQLLSATFRLQDYLPDQIFTASDMNLYYDVRHQQWYNRPDWFGVVGVPRLYDGTDMRLSYVIWQEGISPFVVVELLSPGTEKEDLGETQRQPNQPPTKWEVYEQILRVPYYIVFNRYTDQLRAFTLTAGHYQELALQDLKIWMPELNLGLGGWHGTYQGIERLWLRWYDAEENWILTDAEVAQQQAEAERQNVEAERQRTEAERQRVEQAEARLAALTQRLREAGIDPDTLT